ncbi:MAG: SAM-dependent methyltransferase [Burkholderiales bacterium]
MPGTLYLIPSPLGPAETGDILPAGVQARIRTLRYFIAEHPRTARAFLKQIDLGCPIAEARIATLDEHTPPEALAGLLKPLAAEDGGLISDAGAPAVADPGAALIRLAHAEGLRVAPLVGPSSILLAMMASGLEGQRFAFHGYLPVEKGQLARRLRELETDSRKLQQTQIFIETPYRNDRLMAALVRACDPATLVCLATDLTLATESVRTATLDEWRRQPVTIGKRPTVFLLLASA